ncbi:hypothetical protein DWZ66_04230 [Coprobacillus sp. AF34-1BH]|nr:hypothetical protein DWZ66_04230 [Coprobacillus sp. AF34-1BH]
MKNKKVTKVVLSVLTSMSMLNSYSAMVFAENTNQGTTSQVAHEYDLVKLDRNNDLIINGGFDNNGSSWKKSGKEHLKMIMVIIMENYHQILIMPQFIKQ